jgi:hypothetical protein
VAHRPYEHHSPHELGCEFASALKLGGRPLTQIHGQVAYADLALQVVLDEFTYRRQHEQALADACHQLDDDDLAAVSRAVSDD